MAQFNENIKIVAPNPIDDRYLSTRTSGGSQLPYSASSEVYALPDAVKYVGMTVLIESGGTNVEYWYKNGITDPDLVEKKFASEQLVGDFITGATNMGYFSGTTGIQTLVLAGSGFGANIGNYFSEYNWYYADSSNIVRIGTPTHGGPLRRAYVNAARTKSWIYSVNSGAWQVSLNDVVANVGNSLIVSPHTGYVFTGVTFSGSEGSATASTTAYGSLSTGSTLTIGAPVYSHKDSQDLYLRTPISDTPEFLQVSIDDNYIRFSGVSSVITANNYGSGTGVYSGKSGTELKFRTLVPSGDTTITTKSDGRLIIYSSSDGSANAITGVTNTTGGTGIYSGTTDRNIQLYSLVGSGDTSVSLVDDKIVINSEGGGVFTDDITVSLSGGKTFGKYEDGDTIPASGKTAGEVIILATFEAIDPTPVLSSSGNDVAFGESGKTVNLNFSYTINTPGASIASASLQFYSGSTWVQLTGTTTTPDSFTHNIDDSANRFITGTLQYRYIVVDDAGASGVTTHNVSRQTYAAPSMSITLGGTVPSPQTQNVREKGNVTGGISSGSITSNRSLVNITDWTLERRYNGGGYTVLASGSGLSTLSVSVPSTADGTIPTSATSIDYRLTYTDEYTSGNGGTQSISFRYYSFWGYNTNIVLTETQIEALANSAFKTSQALTWSVTAAISEYTYYAYPSTFSDLTSIIRDGIVEDITAWGKLTDVTVTNSYGEGLLYTVYRTNAPGAYTGNNLVFS